MHTVSAYAMLGRIRARGIRNVVPPDSSSALCDAAVEYWRCLHQLLWVFSHVHFESNEGKPRRCIVAEHTHLFDSISHMCSAGLELNCLLPKVKGT